MTRQNIGWWLASSTRSAGVTAMRLATICTLGSAGGSRPDLVCQSPGEVLDIFLRQRDQPVEIDRVSRTVTRRRSCSPLHRAVITT
jgi:hypothetical protein